MSDQRPKPHPTDQPINSQSLTVYKDWPRLGLSVGLAVLGLGRLSHEPAWAFPTNPSPENSFKPSIVPLAKPPLKNGSSEIQQATDSISPQALQHASPSFSQTQVSSEPTETLGGPELAVGAIEPQVSKLAFFAQSETTNEAAASPLMRAVNPQVSKETPFNWTKDTKDTKDTSELTAETSPTPDPFAPFALFSNRQAFNSPERDEDVPVDALPPIGDANSQFRQRNSTTGSERSHALLVDGSPSFPAAIAPQFSARRTFAWSEDTQNPSDALALNRSTINQTPKPTVFGRKKLPPKQSLPPWRQEFRADASEVEPDKLPNEAAVIGDPELGILRLQEQPLPAPKPPPAVYLSGGVDYLTSDNVFLETDPVNDRFLRTRLALVAVPSLGPQTSAFASVGGSLLRYSDFTDANYNDLKVEVGVRQALFPRTYGQLSWSNQQLFEADSGDRFFNDHSVQLALGRRDPLSSQLNLDSYYQMRFSFSDPNEFNRFIQTLGTSLSYDIAPELQVSLSYQLTLADFTQQARYDVFNQIFGQVTFNLAPHTRFNLFGGFSFGSSSGDDVGFDDTILGLSLNFDLPLF
ncbi:MAG: hypothetical protein QNJ46_10185 [Leptolyngbyaceae cyanobacterium MO_188.B28]|nr:hypothetical protein [Leptolyngbyaceae cyanobacterium MO_188.B28]